MDAEEATCPLCVEVLDPTEQGFFPCPCRYQVCLWCVHHIREQMSGNCPACRKPYLDENFVTDEAIKQKAIDRAKEKEKEAAAQRAEQVELAAAKTEKLSMAEWEEQKKRREELSKLATVRIVQRNVIYVMGIAPSIARADILKRPEFFGQYGNLLRVSVNQLTLVSRNSGSDAYAAYLTFSTNDEAKSAKDSVDGFEVDGHTLKVTFGTTRYCQNFIKDVRCNKADCAFLHTVVEKPERKRRGGQRNRERAERAEKQRDRNSDQLERSAPAGDDRGTRAQKHQERVSRESDLSGGKESRSKRQPDAKNGKQERPVPIRAGPSRTKSGTESYPSARSSRDWPSGAPVEASQMSHQPSSDSQVDASPIQGIGPELPTPPEQPQAVFSDAPLAGATSAATSSNCEARAPRRASSELCSLTPPPMPPPTIPRSPLSARLSPPVDGPPPPNFAPPPIPTYASVANAENTSQTSFAWRTVGSDVTAESASLGAEGVAFYGDIAGAYPATGDVRNKLAPVRSRNDCAVEDDYYSAASCNVWSDASAVSASVSDDAGAGRGKDAPKKGDAVKAPTYAYDPTAQMSGRNGWPQSAWDHNGRDGWSQSAWERDGWGGNAQPEQNERRRRGKKPALEWKPVGSAPSAEWPASQWNPQEWNNWRDTSPWDAKTPDPSEEAAHDEGPHSQGIDLLQSIFPNTKVMLASQKWCDWRPSNDAPP